MKDKCNVNNHSSTTTLQDLRVLTARDFCIVKTIWTVSRNEKPSGTL